MRFKCKFRLRRLMAARDVYLADAAEVNRERDAFARGKQIAGGDADPRHLDAIINWKSARPKTRIKEGNHAAEITEALHIATAARSPRTAVGVLCGLDGVNVPMASAILTAIHPERYTVIDRRALKALRVKKSWLTVDDYLEYLGFCKGKAAQLGISLRDLDRALWVLGGG